MQSPLLPESVESHPVNSIEEFNLIGRADAATLAQRVDLDGDVYPFQIRMEYEIRDPIRSELEFGCERDGIVMRAVHD